LFPHLGKDTATQTAISTDTSIFCFPAFTRIIYRMPDDSFVSDDFGFPADARISDNSDECDTEEYISFPLTARTSTEALDKAGQ